MKINVLAQDKGYRYLSFSSFLNLLYSIIIILFLVCIPVSTHAAKVNDFIPKESVFYIQLNDFNEIYNEIQISEDWERTLDQVLDESDLQEMQQGMLAAQGIIGTDLFGVIDTVGYQTGFAMWDVGINSIRGGIVVHSGGNLAELQRLTKILTGFMGMSGGILKLDAGEHRKVKYNTLQMPDVLFTYGFVSDFLVVGIGENSFEKLIDTYRKKSLSIQKNESYSKAFKKCGVGQVTGFINVSGLLPLLQDLSDIERTQLQTFKTVFAQLNLLEVEPLFQLYTEFDSNLPESRIVPFLKEGDELEILKSLSGKEDLFIAVAPTVLDTVWQLIHNEIENTETDDVHAFITFLEGILNLDFEDDVVAGLTGELALSVDDLTLFEPDDLESLDINIDGTFQIDAGNVYTHGSLIFIPNNPAKWDQIGNSLSNLQNTSVSKTEYKGATVSEFGSNIYYAERDSLSLLSFSEEQMHSLVDTLQEKKKPSYLKQLPKTPLAVVNLNILKLFKAMNEGMPMQNDVIMPAEISPLLAWITVEKNEAVLEISLSDKESPLEVFAKIAPLVVSQMRF
ncbi:MAG: DUF3352 domain-containing protein [Candidatus Poribacteria bacterium]|nr:DUF3352 domain-containing protein [Candidatus Poribacteria bacterium]